MHRPLRSDYTLGLQCQVAALFRPAVWHSHPLHPLFYQRLLHIHLCLVAFMLPIIARFSEISDRFPSTL